MIIRIKTEVQDKINKVINELEKDGITVDFFPPNYSITLIETTSMGEPPSFMVDPKISFSCRLSSKHLEVK